MPRYEVVHDKGHWRILTHHSPTWVERSAALPTAAEAYRVCKALTDSQGLAGEDDEPPAADHA